MRNPIFPVTLSCKKGGMTLTEIIISVALLGMVIITLSGVFVRGLYAIKKGKYRASAIHIGNQKYAELKSLDWTNPLGLPADKLNAPDCVIEGHTLSVPHNNDDYIPWDITADPYEIYGLQEMSGIRYDYYIILESQDKDLKKVQVKVSWEEPEGEKDVTLCTLIVRK